MDWENWKPECEEAELTERESARLRREQAKFDAALEDSAEKLVQLHLDELNALGLPDEMLDAVHVARGGEIDPAASAELGAGEDQVGSIQVPAAAGGPGPGY